MSNQAKKLYKFLCEKKNKTFTLEDMAKASGYKRGSMQTKKNHCLKNVYIIENGDKTFSVITNEIENCTENDFLKQISEKKRKHYKKNNKI